MKTPLRYQMTEFDCGPTSVVNAISYLYDIEEIPPDFIKKIYEYVLDEYDEKGFPGRRGTSSDAMRFIGSWFNRYADRTGFPIRTVFYEGDEVNMEVDSPIFDCLREGGAAVVKCMLEVDHYITLTGIDDRYVHVFDPYFSDYDYLQSGVVFVNDRPKEMNRLIDVNVMRCTDSCDYALCRAESRSALLFSKTGKARTFQPL